MVLSEITDARSTTALSTGTRPTARHCLLEQTSRSSRMNARLWPIAALALLVTTDVLAQDKEATSTAEVALSNDTLQLRYIGSGEKLGISGAQFVAGAFLGEERDFVLDAGVLFPAPLGIDRLQIKVGPKGYAALLSDENNDVMAFCIGLEARYFILPS